MLKRDLLEMLTNDAKKYVAQAQESVIRNRHMNELDEGVEISQQHIEAVVVDFVNYVGMNQCVDWALYTKDLLHDA